MLSITLVFKISNLRFGPEIGVGKVKLDVPVISSWLTETDKISNHLIQMKNQDHAKSEVFLGDARILDDFIGNRVIDAVITSPPYPNEKDYSRTTRLESVILGFIRNMNELRNFKKNLVRSNTRGIYKDDRDHEWIENNEEIIKLANEIENKRLELGKDSGFEKTYSKVTLQYFGGMTKHLANLRKVLSPGANLAYVVGDQASFFQITIRTAELLADIAKTLGYEVVGIDLFRKRFATATKKHMREEVLHLRWNG